MSTPVKADYDDDALALAVGQTLIDEPMINAAELQPTVQNGVITLAGRVPNEILQERIIDAVRRSLDAAGMGYERIHSDLSIG